MSSRDTLLPSVGMLLALAAVAIAIVYFGAIPWALHHLVDATLWFFGLL